MLPVTVVIPTYNGARFIEAALASVVAQTQPPQEILVVDDCSRDETPKLVQAFARRSLVPVRLRQLPTNSGGPAKPMNEGFRESTTPLVAILDQDDLMTSTRLAIQSSVLAAHPEVSAVIGLLRKIDANGLRCSDGFEEDSRRRIFAITHERAHDCCILERSAFYNHVVSHGTLTIGSSTMIRRSVWEAVGGFNLKLRVAWDLELSCQLARLGPVAFVDHVVGSYRLHTGNTSLQGLNCYREVLAVKCTHLRRPLFPIDGPGLKRELAQSHFGLGYHETVLGNYNAAFRAYAKALCFGFPSRQILLAFAKTTLRSAWGILCPPIRRCCLPCQANRRAP